MDNYMLSLLDNMYKQQHHQKDIMPLYQLHSKFKKNQIIPTRSIEFHKLEVAKQPTISTETFQYVATPVHVVT